MIDTGRICTLPCALITESYLPQENCRPVWVSAASGVGLVRDSAVPCLIPNSGFLFGVQSLDAFAQVIPTSAGKSEVMVASRGNFELY
jgi:hypothetical protein